MCVFAKYVGGKCQFSRRWEMRGLVWDLDAVHRHNYSASRMKFQDGLCAGLHEGKGNTYITSPPPAVVLPCPSLPFPILKNCQYLPIPSTCLLHCTVAPIEIIDTHNIHTSNNTPPPRGSHTHNLITYTHHITTYSPQAATTCHQPPHLYLRTPIVVSRRRPQ